MARLGTVSSLDPASRLACLAFLSCSVLFAGPEFVFGLVVALVFLLVQEGLRLAKVIRESAFIIFFSLFTATLRYFGITEAGRIPDIIGEMGIYGIRLLAAFLSGRLLFAATTHSELRDTITRITRRIPWTRRLDIGMGLCMVVMFIPLIVEEWRDSVEAGRSRGMYRRLDLSRQGIFFAAFLRRLMLRAVATPEALVARGWTWDRGIVPLHWRARDSCAVVASGIFAIISALRIV